MRRYYPKSDHAILILLIIIAGMGITITSGIFAQQATTKSCNIHENGEMVSVTPNVATSTQTLHYYDDTLPEVFSFVYTNQYLQIRYGLGGTFIITGITYFHCEPPEWSGSFNLNVNYVGDSANTVYSTVVSNSSDGTWITSGCLGPTYLIDDDPYVQLESNDLGPNVLSIGSDDPTHGHSYSSANKGSSWTPDSQYEYMVDIMYESIPILAKDSFQSGTISGTDYVDAYNVTLTAGKTYEFMLCKNSGKGNLTLRLVDYVVGGTTGSTVNSTSGSSYPKKMRYTPVATTTYMLLVEPWTESDTADYSVVFTEVGAPPDDAHEQNDLFETAYTIATGTYANLFCSDDDWYRLYITAGNTLVANIAFTQCFGDLDLGLYDQDEVQRNYSTTSNDWESVSYAVTTTGYYYIKVYRYYDTGRNSYALTLTTAPTPSNPSGIAGFELFLLIGVTSLAIFLIARKKINRAK